MLDPISIDDSDETNLTPPILVHRGTPTVPVLALGKGKASAAFPFVEPCSKEASVAAYKGRQPPFFNFDPQANYFSPGQHTPIILPSAHPTHPFPC